MLKSEFMSRETRGGAMPLSELRAAKGLTQEEVARRLDMTVKTVVRREHDNRTDIPSGRRIRTLLEGLAIGDEPADDSRPTDPVSRYVVQVGAAGATQIAATILWEFAGLYGRVSPALRSDLAAMFLATEQELRDVIPDPAQRIERAARIVVTIFSDELRSRETADSRSE